ncbi:SHOCT domain-containing protein [Pseudonocardia abyssalis]|jgi:putative membrane protein|uniref:SHOCT domain-containing protein n=1 Tax=Pseudonocardia abyssalis TaxID=2792008 RepID=A0ABS6ULL5_9PSEU|nr:SHOCT domain-containing protein [Pseudonocardia abyssalis]MBW0116361.1 SHOCT domain-containing protein [Pseudonocardia abyssalis]MBW0133144.1 SHOCT domain-containing protein [Pseudonocardia abyssalis]
MMDGSMMGWFWVWPTLVVIGLVLLGYLAYRLTQNRRPGADTAPVAGPTSARQILDERYARGEINDEEYRQRRDTLT